VLNEMLRHTDFMTMAALTMGISTLDYNNTGSVLNTTGLLYKMYRQQLGTLPVAVSGNSPQPTPKYPPYGDQPKTNAGSSTYPLDMVAALTEDHKFLTVAVVNATESEQKLDLNLTGARLGGPPMVCRLTGSSVDAANRVGQPQQVEVKEVPAGDAQGAISVAPISVSIYRFPLAGAA
jgi:alpha-L-arabinofuranosidase